MKTFTCQCGATTQVADDHQGDWVRCSGCGRPVPLNETVDPVEALRRRLRDDRYDSRLKWTGLVLGGLMLLTAVLPFRSGQWSNSFIWQVLNGSGWLVLLIGTWAAALAAVLAGKLLKPLPRAWAYLALGVILLALAAAPVAGAALSGEAAVETSIGDRANPQPLGLLESLVPWSIFVGGLCMLILMPVGHIRLHVTPGPFMRAVELVAGLGLLAGFGFLAVRLGMLLADSAGAGAQQVPGTTVFIDLQSVLTGAIGVIGFAALGGLAAVLDALFLRRHASSGMTILTPIYFLLVVLAGLLLILPWKLAGADLALICTHVLLLGVIRPLLAVYGLAAVVVLTRWRRLERQS
ncbi:MAG: hypothetical protein ABFD92_10230 [Planctomycetaceae bacterium]|nr:hypothetical protein [Planctomycetaceae bacterium]